MSTKRLTSEMVRLKTLPLVDLLVDLQRNNGGMTAASYLDQHGQPEAALVLIAGAETSIYLNNLHQAHQAAELLKAAEALREDLLLRADKRDGVRVVNASDGQWQRFCRSIDDLRRLMATAKVAK